MSFSDLFDFIVSKFSSLFLQLDSQYSAASVLTALCAAILFLILRRPPTKRNVRFAVMMRALFPRYLLRHPSLKADFGYLVLNGFLAGTLFGWALFSADFITQTVTTTLNNAFGPFPKISMHEFATQALMTIAIFLALELAYWTEHYLGHRVPALWEFHKVHHTAEVLTPMTIFRVHPVDGVLAANFSAVFAGVTAGSLAYLFDSPTSFAVNGTNAVLVFFYFLTAHLQHSHIWIAATGPLGYLVFSPAHHQLHHSDNRAHYNKNFGFCLSIWDWLFGTLLIPTRGRERLTFGADKDEPGHHTAAGGLIIPFIRSWETLLRKSR